MEDRSPKPGFFSRDKKGSYKLESESGESTFHVRTSKIEGVLIPTMREFSEQRVLRELVKGSYNMNECLQKKLVFKINDDGIVLFDESNNILICYKLHHIAGCEVSKEYADIIMMIAARTNENIRCHVFLCDNYRHADTLCSTLAKRFEVCRRKIQKKNLFTTTYT